MDISVFQKDFYNRFGVSKNTLFNAKCGMLYTLLGFCDIYGALSLDCVFAPYVSAIGRKFDGKDIIILNTNDVNKKYMSNMDFPDMDLKRGAQILFDDNVPPFFDSTQSYKICIRKLLMKINNQSNDNILSIANCTDNDNISPYIALFKANDGYCIKVSRSDYEIIPLPLNNYKIVVAYSDEIISGIDYNKIAQRSLKLLHKLLPHIKDLSELTLCDVKKILNDNEDVEVVNFLRFIAEENKRIQNAVYSLKKCNITVLFNEMKNSCESMRKLLNLNRYQEKLYSILCASTSVSAFRFFDNSILFITEDEKVDIAINEINERFYFQCGINLNFMITGNKCT